MDLPQRQQKSIERSRLMSLPEELIENVCQQLVAPRYFGSGLAALCRTSKTLNRIATPVLYSNFNACENMKRIAKFLKVIIEKPILAQYVREICMDVFRYFALTPEYTKVFIEAGARLGLDLKNKIFHETGYINEHPEHEAEDRFAMLERYPFETMAQLAIALCPSLRELEVMAHQVMVRDLEGSFTLLEQLAREGRVLLPHLHTFHFGHDDAREISFGYFDGVFQLAPNLRSVSGRPCFDQSHYCPKTPIRIANVTELRLRSGHLSATGLRAIVSSCNRLEIFQHSNGSMYAGVDPPCVTPREAVEILALHKDSLRYLDLELSSREEHRDEDYNGPCIEGDQIVSLKDFSCLETFNIDGTSILFPEVGSHNYHTDVLVDMLPTSIRSVRFRDVQKEAAANMITLTSSISRYPFLTEVFLIPNSNGLLGPSVVDFDDSELDILHQRFSDAGVKFDPVCTWLKYEWL
ncbi:hypothetical protein ABW20_dc0101257 [Dactylellina cionopaga]|nr:hypothetical protein ABW20_dc0101257 [Dactylellina cionopaga]